MSTTQRKINITILAVVCVTLTISAYAQPANPVKTKPPVPTPPAEGRWLVNRHAQNDQGETSEKSIAVVDNVNFSMCVRQGSLQINGWKRNEVRVFVKDGSKIGLVVPEKDPKSQSPGWVKLIALESGKAKYPGPSECVWGDEIEIDVPFRATVNVKGDEAETTVDSVKRAYVKINGGDISLRNVADGITAATWRGGVTVENSHGAVALESTTGNIVVFETGPSEIGDIFKAKTNSGMISLQKVEHRQVEVNSISGSISYNGTMRTGGTYGFTTSNGAIRLTLPQESSCRITATYASGNFNSELPVKMEMENYMPGPVKRIVGVIGKSVDTTLRLTTNNGSISIKKQ